MLKNGIVYSVVGVWDTALHRKVERSNIRVEG